MDLIPVAHPDKALELFRVANRRKQGRLFTLLRGGANHLAAKSAIGARRNAAARPRATFDQRTSVRIQQIEIRLIAAQIPFRVSLTGNLSQLGSAELNTAVCAFAIQLYFRLE